jgi:aerobic carbon-monoxide dehydrogenase medium subunit
MPACRYDRPKTVEDALASLAAVGGDAHVIAGGIALGILMNEKLVEPNWLIDISRIPVLGGIDRKSDGSIRIGALTTHREIEHSDLIKRNIPMLGEMASEIACERIKNRGTIGGNICLADPQGDPPAAVLALRAVLRAVGPKGTRDIPATDFFRGLYSTALNRDELLQEIVFPRIPANCGLAFGKFAARHAMDYNSNIGAAVRLVVEPGSGRIIDVGLGVGGVGETAICPKATEAELRSRKPDVEVLDIASKALSREIHPAPDELYSADYKRHVASVILRRTIERAYERALAKMGQLADEC